MDEGNKTQLSFDTLSLNEKLLRGIYSYGFENPVFTIISSMLLLGERPTPMILIGGAVIIGGVSLIVLTKDPKLVS